MPSTESLGIRCPIGALSPREESNVFRFPGSSSSLNRFSRLSITRGQLKSGERPPNRFVERFSRRGKWFDRRVCVCVSRVSPRRHLAVHLGLFPAFFRSSVRFVDSLSLFPPRWPWRRAVFEFLFLLLLLSRHEGSTITLRLRRNPSGPSPFDSAASAWPRRKPRKDSTETR